MRIWSGFANDEWYYRCLVPEGDMSAALHRTTTTLLGNNKTDAARLCKSIEQNLVSNDSKFKDIPSNAKPIKFTPGTTGTCMKENKLNVSDRRLLI